MKKTGTAILFIGMAAVFILTFRTMDYRDESPETEQEKVIITVLAGQSTSDAGVEDMIDEMIDEKFPGIELEWECVDWGEKFDSQMQGRLAAGDVPDIIVGKAQDVYAYARSGNLAEIRAEGTERIEERILDVVSMDGKIYGIPYNAWYQGVVYNKDIFEKLQLRVPETLEELQQTVKVLEEKGVTPFAAHFQEGWKIGNMTMQFMINNIFREEPGWGSMFRQGERDFSKDDRIWECIEENKYILDHTWEDALIIEQYESDRRFAEGEAAMYLTGSWSLQSMNQYDTSTRYGFFPYPNEEGDASLIKETNMTFMMSKTSPHPDIINDIFTELLQNKKLMQEILGFTSTYPVVKDMSITYQSTVEEDIKKYEDQNRIVDAAIGNNQLVWKFQNDLAEEILKWLNEERSPEQVLSYADKHRAESGY